MARPIVDSGDHAVLRPDPRLLILTVSVWIVLLILLRHPRGLVAAALAALILARALGVPWRLLGRRALALNGLLALWFPLLAFESFAPSAWPWSLSAERTLLFATVVLRANAILLLAQGLAGSMDAATMSCALMGLRCPPKLAHLMLLAARNLEILRDEWHTLYRAASLRGFRLTFRRRPWQTLGVLVGGLTLRSLDRADTILMAMKCRGYQGRVHILRRFRYHGADLVFVLIMLIAGSIIHWLDSTGG